MEKPASRSAPPISVRATHAAALSLRRLALGSPRVVIEDHGAYTSTLRIEGTFKPGWLGSLTAGLAEQGVSIERGFAEADSLGSWEAELLLSRTPTGALPSPSELVRMADRDVRDYSAPRVELAIGSASRVPDHGGSLLVIVEGKDQVGFLASVLTRLADVALLPVEIAISTTAGGRVADRLWLRGPGHREPRPEALHAVTHALHPVLGQ
jgi:hypothetical protein